MNSALGVLASTLPPFLSTAIPVLQKIFLVLMAIYAIIIIVLVLCQPSNSGNGVNALSGATETYYAQNKGRTKEGRLKLATTIFGILMAVTTILYFVSLYIIPIQN